MWCEPILGRDHNLYTSKILDKDVWGGAIEIFSIVVQTGRLIGLGKAITIQKKSFWSTQVYITMQSLYRRFHGKNYQTN
ncbi:hypothetical protein PtA15_4A478 [Puccinia triticina]|uniref:Uncharacterized protein n=1 Tax=Puccinia triticina TaxID=208348 RepID=A0ABY7CML5_9BASI|nr:uncharacterized protein PtA15_4A478 [Puccinia triticina]WAQ84027.1 hypothetical protein PtA15_4A478 [Puccinia triticina]